MTKNAGKEWLAKNDPNYVSPAMKAQVTKRTAWSVESALAYVGGDGCSKAGKNGKRISLANSVCFNGTEDSGYSVEPAIDASQDRTVLQAQFAQAPKRTRGKRGGRKHK